MSEIVLPMPEPVTETKPTVLDFEQKVSDIVRTSLSPLVYDIDQKGVYPEGVMRELGQADVFSKHLPGFSGNDFSLQKAIDAMQIAGEKCLSTSFCIWCQDALGWYIFNSDNAALKARLGSGVATGAILGGTGLSNPMKNFFGIEPLRLKGKRVDGGFVVNGSLPWVSNLGDDHFFGGIFALEDNPEHRVMAAIDCSDAAVRLSDNTEFAALDGTRTFAVQVRDLFIPNELILADPIDEYLGKIRAGFVLLQAGMAFGIIQSSIDLMRKMDRPLGHVNKYLEEQPDEFEDSLASLKDKVNTLAKTPFDPSADYWREVITARLQAGEATVQAAHAAMLHCGARGYVKNGEAQRRLREAYFVAIVTPATKQLRKMLSDMAH